MTPSQHYTALLQQPHFMADTAQQLAIEEFDALHMRLLNQRADQNRFFYPLRRLLKTPDVVNGLYLWGGVGRGKTWMMDLFYETLPGKNKCRMHFHRYIKQVHEQLDTFKGQKNPLRLIAHQFAQEFQLLCLDEFHVSDITDAMILHGLLKALTEHQVTLVFTSNLPPDDLYKDGLQRERFVPAITLIKQVCTVHQIADGSDHRLNTLQAEKVYFSPLSASNRQLLEQHFLRLVPCQPKTRTTLLINQRELPIFKLADDVAWFIFEELFNSPRAVADYIELARLFHTVIISDIPVLANGNDDKARRFIQLMDEFYDRNVKVIISADEQINKLYQGQNLSFEFERTISRVEEMKSEHYLHKPHKP